MARSTRWLDTMVALSNGSGGQVSTRLDELLVEADLRGLTVTRMIGDLSFYSSSVAGAFGTQLVSNGIAMISQEADAAATFPDPNVAVDRPGMGWLWRNQMIVSQNGVGGEVVKRLTFDIRTQRKFQWQRLRFISNNGPDLGTAFTVLTKGSVRVLVLMP